MSFDRFDDEKADADPAPTVTETKGRKCYECGSTDEVNLIYFTSDDDICRKCMGMELLPQPIPTVTVPRDQWERVQAEVEAWQAVRETEEQRHHSDWDHRVVAEVKAQIARLAQLKTKPQQG